MLPIRDEQRYAHFPIVTTLLILINTSVFLYQISLSDDQAMLLVLRFGLIPAHLSAAAGASLQLLLRETGTLISSMFLHGGIVHLAGNLMFLKVFGPGVENALGRIRFVCFYLLGGALAALAHTAVQSGTSTPMIGASGAISAVLGAYFLLYPVAPIQTLVWYFIFVRIVRIPALVFIGLWFLFQLLASMGTHTSVAWFAHIGGFAAGLLLVRVFRRVARRRRRYF